MINLIFFSKSKYPNPIRNNRTRTKNTRTQPENTEIPERILYIYTEIPIQTRTGTRTSISNERGLYLTKKFCDQKKKSKEKVIEGTITKIL